MLPNLHLPQSLSNIFPESNRFFSDNDYSPMNDDETRKFKIDIKNKPKCGLTQDNIMVKKDLVKSKDMIKIIERC